MYYFSIEEIEYLKYELKVSYRIRRRIINDILFYGSCIYNDYLEHELYLIEREIRSLEDELDYISYYIVYNT